MPTDLFDSFPLRKARVHEACGPGATVFAAFCASGTAGQVMWIRPAWSTATLNPVGLGVFFDPARLLITQVRTQTEGLAAMEEALRDGALPLVVSELTEPLDLTAGRRLQLAARYGDSTGICLIPEGMGSNAAETRWRCAPVYGPGDPTLQRWDLIKNKSGTDGAWHVRWDAAARRLRLVRRIVSATQRTTALRLPC